MSAGCGERKVHAKNARRLWVCCTWNVHFFTGACELPAVSGSAAGPHGQVVCSGRDPALSAKDPHP